MKSSFRIEEMQRVIERWKQRAEAAEAELARLKEQEPVCFIHPKMLDYVYGGSGTSGRVWGNSVDEISNEDRIPLYTAAQPSALPPENPQGAGNLAKGWNDCSERMPNVQGSYLVWISSSKEGDGYRDYIDISRLEDEMWDCAFGWHVTHWMPLPAAPGDK